MKSEIALDDVGIEAGQETPRGVPAPAAPAVSRSWQSHQAALSWMLAHCIPTAGLAVSDRLPLSYPEVTGYTIPTLLSCGVSEIALGLARWIISIQHPTGGYSGADGHRVPYVFDTGQVLRGLLAVAETLEPARDAIRHAADWMLAHADDGILRPRRDSPWFRRYGAAPDQSRSSYAAHKRRSRYYRDRISEDIHLYALPPLEAAGRMLGEPRYTACVERSLDYYLGKRDLVQWRYLSHFYGYVLEALVDLGQTDLACKGLHQVMEQQGQQGAIPAVPGATWSCLPGSAQLACVGYKLGFMTFADLALRHLQSVQMPNGGFPGSYGPGAAYYSGTQVSWACKFFLDASNLHLRYWQWRVPSCGDEGLLSIQHKYGTAWNESQGASLVAQGLAAYQRGDCTAARSLLLRALRHDASWAGSRPVLSALLSSLLGTRAVGQLRRPVPVTE